MTRLRLFVDPQPAVLRVGGHSVTVAAGNAAVWLAAVADENWHLRILRMLNTEDQVTLARALAQGSITEVDVVSLAKDAIAAASGMEWWRAMRISISSPDVWGALALRGVQPDALTYAGWLATVVALLHEGQDSAGRAKVDMALDVPPDGESSSAWDMDPSAWGG